MHERFSFHDPSDERSGDRLRFVGAPTFSVAQPYGDHVVPGATATSGDKTHTAFLVWLVLLGIVLPVMILGGLQVAGFKYVFKGR